MGASQTKQTSILEQVNNIVNETVNKSSTSIKSNAVASQSMKISCTDKQLELAGKANPLLLEAHVKTLESYYKYGANGIPPKDPILLCTASGVSQNATVSLKSDSQSLNSMAQQITTELQAKAKQVDDLQKTTPMLGYSETDKNTINQIITNVKNSSLNESVLEIVNSAIVNQDMDISGSGVVNANQEATVNLITGSIIENITKNVNKADLGIESGQESKMEEKSGQVEALKGLFSMVGNMFAGLMGSWILILVCIIGAVVMFPGVFCMIPPLRIPLGLMGLCSQKNTEQQPQPQFIQQPQPQYIPYPLAPQFIQQQQPQPQYIPYPSAPRDYSNIIVPKNDPQITSL